MAGALLLSCALLGWFVRDVPGGAARAAPVRSDAAAYPDRLDPLPARLDDARAPYAADAPHPGPAAAQPLVVAASTGRYGPEIIAQGRTAKLAPAITVASEPAPVLVRVVAGPNRGAERRLAPSESWEGLWPGYARVEVLAASGERCVRDLELRHRKPTPLTIDLDDHGVLHGVVHDERGAPLAGARVSLDGREQRCDLDGRFRLRRRASGEAELLVDLAGFVPRVERLRTDVGRSDDDPVLVALERGRSLVIRLDALSGGDGGQDAALYVLPASGARIASRGGGLAGFPWHELNPIRVRPGGEAVLHDLPRGRLDVRAFHDLARGVPTFAWLDEADAPVLQVSMTPLPTLAGAVVSDGQPVSGARVALRHANPFAATQQALGDDAHHYRSQPIELLPQVSPVTISDGEGRFALGLDPAVREAAFLSVTSPDGALVVTRRIDGTAGPVVIDLARPGA